MSRVALVPNSRSDPDHIFYTATIINNNTSTSGNADDPIARFVETRDVPILRDANDYDVNILKVSLNGAGKTLPILIPQVKPYTSYNVTNIAYASLTFEGVAGWGVTLTIANTQVGNPYLSTTVIVAPGNGQTQIGTGNNKNLAGTWKTVSTSATTIVYHIPTGPSLGTTPITGIPLGDVTVTFSDPTMTIYSLQLTAAVYDAAQTGTNSIAWVSSGNVFIRWVPENWNSGTDVPTTAEPSQLDSSYYYLYSYNHWVVLVNQALAKAYTNLQANINLVPALTAFTLKNRCPTVEFDETTKLFSFYTDTTNTAWGLTEGPPTYTYLGPSGTNVLPTTSGGNEFLMVGYNLNFEGLMTNFDTVYMGNGTPWVSGFRGASTATQLYYPENLMIVRNKSGTNVQTAINPATGLPYSPTAQLSYVTTQDFISVDSLWSPVGAIVLTTQLLPIRNEFTSAPVALGAGNLGSGGTSAFQTVLIDFADDKNTADAYRGMLSYTPMAEFIPVSMTQSHQEVKSIDFLVSWRNRLTNQLVPLRLYNCASLSVRMYFKRKT